MELQTALEFGRWFQRRELTTVCHFVINYIPYMNMMMRCVELLFNRSLIMLAIGDGTFPRKYLNGIICGRQRLI